jgi:hypothetical protein
MSAKAGNAAAWTGVRSLQSGAPSEYRTRKVHK